MTATTSLIVFGLCILLLIWDKLPMATAAILGCVAMVVTGVCDFDTVFGQFASNTIIFLIGGMVIGGSMSETGLGAEIGRWIGRVMGKTEKTLIVGTYLTAAVMSAFLANSTVMVLFIPIIMGVAAADSRVKVKNITMPIAIGCATGGASTLVGSTQQMVAQRLLEGVGGRTFHVFDFTPVGGILVVMGLIYCLTVGVKRGERIWGGREDDTEYEVPAAGQDDGKQKKLTMGVIFACMAAPYITELFPVAVTCTLAALACIVTGCITQKRAIAAINWNVIGRMGAFLGLAEALKVGGGLDLVADIITSLVGASPDPYLLFCVIILITLLITEFVSHATTTLIVLPVVLSIAPGLGLNTNTFALGVALAAGVGLCCPLGSNQMSISMCVGYRFTDFFKYSIFLDIMEYLVIILTVPAFYGLTA